jgi:hypothetical protein
MPFIDAGNNNFTHSGACWGFAAEALFGHNTYSDRKFLYDFHGIHNQFAKRVSYLPELPLYTYPTLITK